jgi:hypothetical protein
MGWHATGVAEFAITSKTEVAGGAFTLLPVPLSLPGKRQSLRRLLPYAPLPTPYALRRLNATHALA